MKLKLMIALVVLALVFGMTFTACDDGDAPEIQDSYKNGAGTTKINTDRIYDLELLNSNYIDNPKVTDFGKYNPPAGDTTDVDITNWGTSKPNIP